jgi:hypothetical protein
VESSWCGILQWIASVRETARSRVDEGNLTASCCCGKGYKVCIMKPMTWNITILTSLTQHPRSSKVDILGRLHGG